MAEGSIPSPWNIPEAEQPLKSMQTSSGAGLELLPDLASLEALAEQLVFQATGQEHAEVQSGRHNLLCDFCALQPIDCHRPEALVPCIYSALLYRVKYVNTDT